MKTTKVYNAFTCLMREAGSIKDSVMSLCRDNKSRAQLGLLFDMAINDPAINITLAYDGTLRGAATEPIAFVVFKETTCFYGVLVAYGINGDYQDKVFTGGENGLTIAIETACKDIASPQQLNEGMLCLVDVDDFDLMATLAYCNFADWGKWPASASNRIRFRRNPRCRRGPNHGCVNVPF